MRIFVTLVWRTFISWLLTASRVLKIATLVLESLRGPIATRSQLIDNEVDVIDPPTARSTLHRASTYNEWRAAARVLDDADGFQDWRLEEDNRLFHFDEVLRRIRRLYDLRSSRKFDSLLEVLQTDFHRDMCGISNPLLYEFRTGTKAAITTYVQLVSFLISELPRITALEVAKEPQNAKNQLLRRYKAISNISRAYGTTALVLNSSAFLGAYHLGVVKGLHDAGLLPRIIFGKSTGAIVAAFLCCNSNVEAALQMEGVNFTAFTSRQRGGTWRKLRRFFTTGTLMDADVLLRFVEDNIGPITFLEAYRLTGRVLNIHVSREVSRGRDAGWLMNYITAPHVLVATAAVASCWAPGLYGLVALKCKTIDGSIVEFQPHSLRFTPAAFTSFHVNRATERMRELFNVRTFIVADASISQLPFLTLARRKHPIARTIIFFVEEWWRVTAAVTRIPLFQSRLTGIVHSLLEPIQGDVLIYPVTGVGDVLKLLSNPDRRLLDHCILRGIQQVWPKLSYVRTLLAIEGALERAMQPIKQACLDELGFSALVSDLEHFEF